MPRIITKHRVFRKQKGHKTNIVYCFLHGKRIWKIKMQGNFCFSLFIAAACHLIELCHVEYQYEYCERNESQEANVTVIKLVAIFYTPSFCMIKKDRGLSMAMTLWPAAASAKQNKKQNNKVYRGLFHREIFWNIIPWRMRSRHFRRAQWAEPQKYDVSSRIFCRGTAWRISVMPAVLSLNLAHKGVEAWRTVFVAVAAVSVWWVDM